MRFAYPTPLTRSAKLEEAEQKQEQARNKSSVINELGRRPGRSKRGGLGDVGGGVNARTGAQVLASQHGGFRVP